MNQKWIKSLFLSFVIFFIISQPSNALETGLDNSSDIVWKAVVLGGCYSDDDKPIMNWDRSREKFHHELLLRGILPENIRILSALDDQIGRKVEGTIIKRATEENFFESIKSLNLKKGDGLIVFLTSHGSKERGFYFELGLYYSDSFLGIEEFNQLLDDYATDLPTILLISACYSGQYIQGRYIDENSSKDSTNTNTINMTRSNRIIMTAASNRNSSFGCGSGSEMPWWDSALHNSFQNSLRETTWEELYQMVYSLIDEWETKEFVKKSNPQSWVGADFTNQRLFGSDYKFR